MKNNLALIIMTAAVLTGCSRGRELAPLQKLYLANTGTVQVQAKFCVQDPNVAKQKLKLLFVIDKSSSNQLPPESSDPVGTRRYAPLVDFLASAQQDVNTYYGLVNFSTGAQVVQEFSNNLQAFRDVVRSEWTGTGTVTDPRPRDFGETDYLGGVQAARNEIERDLKIEALSLDPNTIASSYKVIFLSDGYPMVGGAPQAPANIQNLIEAQIPLSLLALRNDPRYRKYVDEIQLHSGYYFSAAFMDLGARDLLNNMATWGTGEFHIFGAGAAIDYALFALPVRHVRYHIADVLVENLSTIWTAAGAYKLDTDGDGMDDELEDLLHSNPYASDSDGNGVSDGVEYRSKGKPCNDAGCSPDLAKRDNYLPCQGLPKTVTGDSYVYADSDRDGLNDCEEWVLRSDQFNFDSNFDRIPDGAAFRNRMQFIAGTNDAAGDPDFDGASNYTELKRNTPMNTALTRVVPSTYRLVPDEEASTPEIECFELVVKDVATLGFDNRIQLTIIENQDAVVNKAVSVRAERKVSGSSHVIDFSAGDFK